MPFYVWLTIAVIFTIVEIFTAGFFYACFAAGAVAAWITTIFTGNGIIQILVFCLVSVGLIPLTRSFARRVTDESVPQAGADALVGAIVVVTETIKSDHEQGKVLIQGQEWIAESSQAIAKGAKARIASVKGARLVIKPLDKEENKNA